MGKWHEESSCSSPILYEAKSSIKKGGEGRIAVGRRGDTFQLSLLGHRASALQQDALLVVVVGAEARRHLPPLSRQIAQDPS